MQARQRMSALTALFLGATAVVVAMVTSGAIIVIYGMHLGDRWAGEVLGLTGRSIENLPELLQAMPPAISDALDDRREPEYAANLNVAVQLADTDGPGGSRPVVTVENRGDQTVTLLGLRVIALDEGGTPVREWTEYAATPFSIDHDWRGPMLPSATRRFSLCPLYGARDGVTAEWEITDVRVWSRHAEAPAGPSALSAAASVAYDGHEARSVSE